MKQNDKCYAAETSFIKLCLFSYEDAAKEYRQILTSTSRKQSDDDVKTEEIKKVVNPARLLITQQVWIR